MILARAVFWMSLLFVVYAYVGYPLLLRVITFFRQSPGGSAPGKPAATKVSLLISAFNEEQVIEQKILNSLALRYPKNLLEIVIVSDGSTDQTTSIVERYRSRGVRLEHYDGRRGKTACLNDAVPSASGEIIVFSDANSHYEAEAVRHLVDHFADPRVGFVTGHTRYYTGAGQDPSASVGVYSRLERFTKAMESKMGICIGADGAVFAIRKSLFRNLRKEDINDLVIPLNILREGRWGIQEEKAFCRERTPTHAVEEVGRQVRIANRTLRAIWNNRDLLNPLRHGALAWALFSHKLAKLLVPFALLSLTLANILLFGSSMFHRIALAAQAICLLLAGLGSTGRRSRGLFGLGSVCYDFLAVNLAMAAGWLKCARGETYVRWSPLKR